ncbi:outer membrane receptor for ferrienterochelin and colicins [Paracoccus thiocyanatus]|uniref:Outer membrane receptor for ferrienterochelin and colicins n=1 Tax=Paracoccus thiocyanatus TaxID=34006 RepID=A0A1N6W1G8_9RHOB|nr:TonB-dependent receptor [Paracoccus thiocyanatus]SIQ83914.1 outer membrane receptor for ferrienterochelin and colicins [Paracoccus thiocyanatus]
MKRLKNTTADLRGRLPLWLAVSGAVLPVLAGPAGAQDLPAPAAEVPATVQLDTVVVTATGQAQALPDAPATMTVIRGEDIAKRPYASITDVLKTVPGVVLNSAGSKTGLPSISMRGMGSGYVLMLVDGKPVGNSTEATYNGFGGGQAESYLPPPSAIDRIEVIRGPMSSLYGTAASGGVINVITKPVDSVWSGEMTLGATTHEDNDSGSSHEGRFYLSGPLIADRLGLSLFGSLHEREGDRNYAGGSDGYQVYDNTRKSLGARLAWSIDDDQKLTFEHVVTDNSSSRTSEEDGGEGGIDIDRKNSSVTHDLSWGAGYETTTFVNHEDVDFINGDNASGYKQLNINSKTARTFGRHDLVLGFDYRDEETRHAPDRIPEDVDPVMTRSQWAVFAEDSFHVTDDLTVTMGLRYDDNERYGSHVTPRLYGVWHVSERFTLKGGVSGGYKVPQLKQADSNIYEPAGRGRGWDQGNTALEPEESTNFEIGAVWEGETGLQLGLTAYHTRFTNKIDRDRICEGPEGSTGCRGREYISQYVNRDEAELNGIEATADYAFGDFELGANYTYSDSKITKGPGEGEGFNDLPRHVLNLSLDWYATDALMVWGNAQYRSATRDEATETGHVGEHAILDLGVDYDFNDRVSGTLAVYNVADKSFDNGYSDGRRLYLGLTSSF